jgi:predicted nucleotidyltransferase
VVRGILSTQVPDCAVYVFGSRAVGSARAYSDLDLAVKGEAKLAPSRLQALRDAFAESDLPIKVDVVDWQAISAGFQDAIRADLVLFHRGAL